MKTRLITAVALLCIALGSQAQKHDFANWKRYADANKENRESAKDAKYQQSRLQISHGSFLLAVLPSGNPAAGASFRDENRHQLIERYIVDGA